jgi:hypothetical protein
MKTAVFDCETLTGHLEAYLDNTIKPADAIAFETHLEHCEACRKSVHYARAVRGLIGYVEIDRRATDAALVLAETPSSSMDRLGAAPWWLVSASMHILLIALASLVSMSIELPKADDSVVMLTELQSRVAIKDEPAEKPKAATDVLNKAETPATDPDSKEASDIVVPPDILARAELGDHFETINPDRPDTHSAYGNEESRSFHSIEGNAEPPGGGGMGGLGMDDLIGVGGAASRGSGGGFGGGNGTGVGIGDGPGKGSFGGRGGGRKLMVKRHGGSKETESAVDKALQWLAYHQEADGHWDVLKYGGGKSIGFGCSTTAASDVGMTALAAVAFLGAGHTHRVGSYRDNVKRALDYLLSHQKPNGAFNDVREQDYDRYDTTLATLALSEDFGMSGEARMGEAAQKGIDNIVSLQQAHGGWIHYTWNSTSFFGWVVMALKSAKIARLKVPPDTFEKAVTFLDKAAEKDSAGYWGKVRYDPFNAFEVNKGLTMTAVGMTALIFLGHGAETGRQADMLAQDLPEWDPGRSWEREPQNFYYWYYGTLGMFQTGGDHWKKWNEALKATLLPNQCKDGDNAGSWDPVTAFDGSGGRVYSTAMGALSLEVYYRYLRLASEK